jgi:8-oxo-dGTP pyrophosphatase MutT (NUDIX family)
VDVDKILNLSERFLKLAQRNIGAGILFICSDDNTTLLIQRSPEVEEPGTWGISGGGLEGAEKPSETAVRETKEELGSMPQRASLINTMVKDDKGGEYHIFIMNISEDEKAIWAPQITLNHESSQFKWFRTSNLPENLHSAISIIQT